MTAAEGGYSVWEFEPLIAYPEPPPRLENSREFERAGLDFKRGEKITLPVPVARFVAHPRQQFNDYLFNAAGWPLCSSKLRSALEQAGVDTVQYFTAELMARSTKRISADFRVANFVGKLKRGDWETSGQKLFRMEEDSSVLVVAASVRMKLEELKITGVRFTDLPAPSLPRSSSGRVGL